MRCPGSLGLLFVYHLYFYVTEKPEHLFGISFNGWAICQHSFSYLPVERSCVGLPNEIQKEAGVKSLKSWLDAIFQR